MLCTEGVCVWSPRMWCSNLCLHGCIGHESRVVSLWRWSTELHMQVSNNCHKGGKLFAMFCYNWNNYANFIPNYLPLSPCISLPLSTTPTLLSPSQCLNIDGHSNGLDKSKPDVRVILCIWLVHCVFWCGIGQNWIYDAKLYLLIHNR